MLIGLVEMLLVAVMVVVVVVVVLAAEVVIELELVLALQQQRSSFVFSIFLLDDALMKLMDCRQILLWSFYDLEKRKVNG